jgi:hypothetical protein
LLKDPEKFFELRRRYREVVCLRESRTAAAELPPHSHLFERARQCAPRNFVATQYIEPTSRSGAY